PVVAPPPPLARPPAVLPAEADMTDAQRRKVQTALGQLGYYDGTVDGRFGPDTRAAIRRFQHEIHATMTGRLTADQATRLVTPTTR
ncbi:MAG: peptidoglycan-binding domain-containing protein, partial [Acetobacteraceae bacterium]